MSKRRLIQLNQIVDCVVQTGGGGATRKQIAECLQIKVSPYLHQLLQQCLDEGYLVGELDDSGKRRSWKYTATDRAIA